MSAELGERMCLPFVKYSFCVVIGMLRMFLASILAFVIGIASPLSQAAEQCILPKVAEERGYNLFGNIEYAVFGGSPQYLDFYRSKRPGNRPLVVLIHGGAWKGGSKNNFNLVQYARRFISLGYHVAIFDYPLANAEKRQNLFPTALQSLRCGMRWLHKQANDNLSWRIDKGKIAIFGSSAGANLAAMVTYTPSSFTWMDYSCSLKDSQPMLKARAAVLFAGIYDLTEPAEFERPRIRNYLGAGDPAVRRETAFRASPIRYVELYGSSKSVPAFLAHSAHDTTVGSEQSRLMSEAMERKQMRHELTIVDHSRHTMPLFAVDGSPFRDISCRALLFIRNILE